MANKKSYGLNNLKHRTAAEIDKDYNFNALNYGHKKRLIQHLQTDVETHMTNMLTLTEEAGKLPKQAPEVVATPTAAPEAVTAPTT